MREPRDAHLTIEAFLAARLNEAERLALAAAQECGGAWDGDTDSVREADAAGSGYIAVGPWGSGVGAFGPHAALHDPAHVLREVEAWRAILEMYTPEPLKPVPDAELHARGRHPEWEYRSTAGQRKAFHDYNVPPEGEGWVRNVEQGRDGWERFDYTEESYWRRRRPADQVRQPEPPQILKVLAAVHAGHPGYRREWAP
ncbi:DUF6221 family protein [Actinocorallia herbida]|uniref:DUF6221 family protein n=1 Tax=Actinocorallia herbida TaxID=58109 RepID=UPI000F4D1447|nr:DUF6221 family protein [Actinocorallia herbida]